MAARTGGHPRYSLPVRDKQVGGRNHHEPAARTETGQWLGHVVLVGLVDRRADVGGPDRLPSGTVQRPQPAASRADVDVAVDDDRRRTDLAVALELPASGQSAAVPLLKDALIDEVALAAVEGRCR